MPDDDLKTAASDYARKYLTQQGFFPTSSEIIRLSLELAFMQGAQWYNQVCIKRSQIKLVELEAELAQVKGGIPNARP